MYDKWYKQVTNRYNPRHVECMSYPENEQAIEEVEYAIYGRRLYIQSGHCHAKIQLQECIKKWENLKFPNFTDVVLTF